MEFAAVFHRSTDNYCYALDDNQLIINLKTGYDVKIVNIIYGDPFRWRRGMDGREGGYSF